MRKFVLVTLLYFIALSHSIAQPVGIIDSKKKYKSSIITSAKNELRNLKKLIPQLVLDLKYSTAANFTHTNLYNKATTTYLRKDAAVALQNAALHLKKLGYAFKIWDAYRPYTATKLMWELIKDERYVANPKNGSNHNKGMAIDLTLVDANGTPLNMGTDFDNFTDTAHHSFTSLPQSVLNNRKLLKETMELFGFKALETEWWHYSFITTETYAVLDLSFKRLQKLTK
jgi:zinc D-Ala-D-Ala dipeptidase